MARAELSDFAAACTEVYLEAADEYAVAYDAEARYLAEHPTDWTPERALLAIANGEELPYPSDEAKRLAGLTERAAHMFRAAAFTLGAANAQLEAARKEG